MAVLPVWQLYANLSAWLTRGFGQIGRIAPRIADVGLRHNFLSRPKLRLTCDLARGLLRDPLPTVSFRAQMAD
jgi:hypothetical protein